MNYGNMDLNDYQYWLVNVYSPSFPNDEQQTPTTRELICMRGLFGELGEFFEKLKKRDRDGASVTKELLTLELGDVLAYLTLIADANGLSIDEAFIKNKQKLEDRMYSNKQQGSGDLR